MWNPFKTKSVDVPAGRKSRAFILGMNNINGMGSSYAQLATEGYAQNAVVFACISKIANAISSVDLDAYKETNGNLEKMPNHELEQLIENPNPRQSGRSFRKEFVTQYLIGGNCFLFGTGLDGTKKQKPKELYILSPDKMEVIRGDQLPAAYRYKPSADKVTDYPVDRITGKSAVLHIKTPNPLDTLIGLPPLAAAAYGVDIFNSGMRWNKKLLDNDCRPSGALTVEDSDGKPRALSDEQYKALKEELASHYSGANNAGRPLLLEGGLKWQEMGISPKDMDFQENILMASRFIASVFNVPPQLVNIKGESTYSNYEQAQLSFWADTVLPLLGSMLEDINRWLSPMYDGVYLWYDEEAIPALEPIRKIKSDRVSAAPFYSTNEKRDIMGVEAVEGGDEILIDSGKIPLSLMDASITAGSAGE